ncbi:MAG TPA: glucans biosynthesis glucosyltransferase MdoH [Methylibium sp.]|uniref:glucans biosynthesis glucosyltransferase MdoH n=1 Tax=Methylibium sp. TaxID=2067992 RepID=UPI002DBC6490|nr:glucans biosynthesis glucosyltransferase MdoH [Methylibium sp.]HEU4460649.1 glucans biosynthesis glucosyltransferase MdoH [Methylibium sp.]
MDLRPARDLIPQALAEPAATAPRVQRAPMRALPWSGLLARGLGRASGTAPLPARPALRRTWEGVGAHRRRILLVSMLVATVLATWVLGATQQGQPSNPGRWIGDGLFAALFAWVCGGFLTAVMGWWSLRRGDPSALDPSTVAGRPIEADARTAVVMPVYNEDMASVSACLRATIESLSRAGDSDRFDFFILSDSKSPEQKRIERDAWGDLRAALAADGYDASRVHIRWRLRSGRKKAGNVADFCRRWGASFRYMVVLDADSVMSGEALLSMVRLMEAHPRAGIIQTAPRSVGLDSLHARLQQFAGRLTGPLFAAGLRYWQLGDSHYWGHNAILRVEPFMQHCALAPLPGSGGLSGDILSHDFVEAALMRRAGYEVWLLPDMDGSYEQPPAHLVDELQRDRRWCQGNLQNARLITEPGLAPVHRALFVAGAMSYVASPLWLGFVLIGLLPWVADAGMAAVTGQGTADALPLPVLALWASTLVMLLLPRALAVEAVIARGEAEGFGGRFALVRSAALEAVIAALQAPVRMLAHSIFVIGALTGLKLEWRSPSREAKDIGWREALRRFGVGGVLACGVFAWWLAGAPGEAWKLLPLALPLAIAVPLAVWTSRPSVGAAWRRRGWLLTPEESRPPQVLRSAWRHAGRERPLLPASAPAALGGDVAIASRTGAGAGWAQRTTVGLGLAFGLGAIALPEQVAHGGLGHGEIAAMNIVMQASSPSAEPRVVARGTLPLRRVAAPARATTTRMPVAADSQRI